MLLISIFLITFGVLEVITVTDAVPSHITLRLNLRRRNKWQLLRT